MPESSTSAGGEKSLVLVPELDLVYNTGTGGCDLSLFARFRRYQQTKQMIVRCNDIESTTV